MEAIGVRALPNSFFRYIYHLKFPIMLKKIKDYIMGPDGIMYEMVEIPKPDGNYIVLEFLNKESNSIDSPFFLFGK